MSTHAKFIWLDLLERTFVVILFSVFAVRLLSNYNSTSGIAVPLLVA